MKAASPHALLRAQFLRFAAVGGAGFFVDEGVLGLFHNALGLSASIARMVSIFCAMSFTWWGNRTLTFHEHAARGALAAFGEWLRFIAANTVGALVNYSTFLALLHFAPEPASNPFIATALGVCAGLTFNFFGSRAIVFTAKPAAEIAEIDLGVQVLAAAEPLERDE